MAVLVQLLVGNRVLIATFDYFVGSQLFGVPVACKAVGYCSSGVQLVCSRLCENPINFVDALSASVSCSGRGFWLKGGLRTRRRRKGIFLVSDMAA
ncbi:hypothetical protein CBR_g48504 [Chara braunii]|uniref:Uncharacterized protein n=1 Tax=Chara braunii TaxID=69332 RepID=A0A388M323_CHABU|nr:hypothetical protein CBR_g48504 [Chara braunii]|eukprot:GBG88892.1 hypothetical protein CBR_g48504 [Chara braunii]